MARPSEADILGLLHELHAHGVEFVVVGGAAAVMHGAPVATIDLDIVPRQEPANLDRLHACLVDLDAIHREPGTRELRPQRGVLDGQGQILTRTRLGPLDVLLRLHGGETYADLAPRSVTCEVDGLTLRLIDLPALVAIKSATGRARDRIAVPLLLDLLRRTQG